MFDKILKFFIQNYKLNYAIFFLIYAFGIYAYLHIPKEVSPVIEPDSITIRGDYRGASIDSLNTMAVNEIEHNIKNIDGVDSVSSTITNGRFSITVELKSGANKDKVSKDIEDSIKTISLPDDMDEPTIRSVPHSRSIINVVILSNKISRDKLLTLASKLKDKLLNIKDVSNVML
ncbi:MAG: efflux RND transporter permease subunit, partial [Epsilonproteobacteria bacterium]|nr:efflux RND transporter permease subunit [Campylobacterota bacterium]